MAAAAGLEDKFPMMRETIAMEYPHYHEFVGYIMDSHFDLVLAMNRAVEWDMHRLSGESTASVVTSSLEARRDSMADVLRRFPQYIHGNGSSCRPGLLQQWMRRCYCYYIAFPLYILSRRRDYLGLLPYIATLLSKTVTL